MTVSIANLLKLKKEIVLSKWEERTNEEVKSAEMTSSWALRNSIPIYLDHLTTLLEKNLRMDFKSVYRRDQAGTRIGKEHGAERAGNKNYSLSEVISEYHILRTVLFDVLEVDGPMETISRDIILDSIDQVVNDAAVEFSEVHADIQQKFISTLTHDLKTPITSAKMSAELILKSGNVDAATVDLSKRIVGSMNRLTSMIHDLLDASRVRAGEALSLEFGECDLDEVIHNVTNEMTVIYGDRFTYQSKGSAFGLWSSDGLRRVVENLVGNAVKYGSPMTPIAIELSSVEMQEPSVRISVHNQGSIIAESEVALLFEQYRRSKNVQQGGKAGWGLGLTLVKGVVDAHRGKIQVESAESKGTRFIIDLPKTTLSKTIEKTSSSKSETENRPLFSNAEMGIQ